MAHHTWFEPSLDSVNQPAQPAYACVDRDICHDYQFCLMSAPRFHGFLPFVFVACTLMCATGCDLAAITIKATADGTKKFTDEKGNEFADPEMVGPVLASGVVQSEGFL